MHPHRSHFPARADQPIYFLLGSPGISSTQIIHAPHPSKGFFRVLVQEWARSNANG